MTLLQAALAKVDELIAALTNGKLIGTAVPAAAAAPAAPAAVAAAAPTSGPSAGSAAVASTAKKPKPAKAAAKPAVDEGDAFDKAQLAVRSCRCRCLRNLEPLTCIRSALDRRCLFVPRLSLGSNLGCCPSPSPHLLKVGRVTSVSDHPSGSEKLWLLRVDIGGGVERQVKRACMYEAVPLQLWGWHDTLAVLPTLLYSTLLYSTLLCCLCQASRHARCAPKHSAASAAARRWLLHSAAGRRRPEAACEPRGADGSSGSAGTQFEAGQAGGGAERGDGAGRGPHPGGWYAGGAACSRAGAVAVCQC